MSNELKPCPFCGHSAVTSESYKKNEGIWNGVKRIGYNIRCCKCRAEMHGKNWKSLVTAWNRRAKDEQGDC